MKPFSTIAAGVFALVAIAHLLRLFAGWEVSVNGINVPLWLSAVAFAFTAAFAATVWREAQP